MIRINITKALHALAQISIIGLMLGVLYLIYLPFGFVRVLVDMERFNGFVGCVCDCIDAFRKWFRKGGRQ